MRVLALVAGAVASAACTSRPPDAAHAGAIVWARQLGSPGRDEGAVLALDRSGNVLVAGNTEGSFDGLPFAGGVDAFVVKLGPDGSRRWGRSFGSATTDQARGITADLSGNVYVAGSTSGDLDGNGNRGAVDLFVVKLAPDGAWSWTRQFGTVDYESDLSGYIGLAADPAGNVFVAGTTWGDFDAPGVSTSAGPSPFVVSLAPDGATRWLRQLRQPFEAGATAIAVDRAGDLLVAGHSKHVSSMFPNGVIQTFLAKLDPDGVPRWFETFAAPFETPSAIVVTEDGTSYIAGASRYGGGVVKVDAAGAVQWITGQEIPGPVHAATAVADGVLLAGAALHYSDGASTKPMTLPSTPPPASLDGAAPYALHLDAAGRAGWTFQLPPVHDWVPATGVGVDAAGDVVLAGHVLGAIPGCAPVGYYDVFVLKVAPTSPLR